MKKLLLLIFTFTTLLGFSQQKGKLEFFNTDWGRTVSWDTFCERTKASGYDGIEIWFPPNEESQKQLKAALEKHKLKVGFLNGTNKSLPFKESLKQYTDHFKTLLSWNPAYINCHTGNDFFSMEQNKAFIDVANKIAEESGTSIYHETHRGRFSYNLPDTEKYMTAIPDLKLTLDISHWMVVHESLLENQDENLKEVISRSHHIHARVGHAEGPQVNDPEAPEWERALNRHLDIWEKVILQKWAENYKPFTITSEFGPPDYMPTLPYTRVPVADQWKANVFIMQAIKKRMNVQ
ncbi:sugar phosphate isomerase/epimerase [Maribacter algarum]|uniref:Sugar phosphate isomerase/epimerase n=1 Tax=Maribacter algarum (ex Zhang et al. 2020) TaxID=2578118 RepID=A0A5S3PDZ4_9FLAO|nr:sugar phosphate isomerase/epimerase [Maribacter algarum]TMM52208.1 sugar phosphate isomerase/epimerase [Maribacter algarum]